MCKFCEENYEIDTMIGERQVIIKLDEEQKNFVKIRLPFAGGGGITKPMQINYCPFCGKSLKGFSMGNSDKIETIKEMVWDNGNYDIDLRNELCEFIDELKE